MCKLLHKKRFIIPGVVVLLIVLFVLQDVFLAPPDKKFFFHNSSSLSSSANCLDYPGLCRWMQDNRGSTQPIGNEHLTADPKETDKFITYSPVDPSQIQYIDKFRSCHGHDVFGIDYNGESEPLSAMKMYFKPINNLLYTNDKVNVYAPFNGIVVQVDPGDTIRGRHYVIRREPFNGWYITMFHQNFSDSVVYPGAKVQAGELISHAVTTQQGHDFDIALQRFRVEDNQYNGIFNNYNFAVAFLQNLEPLFPHMTNNVFAQWEAYGVYPDNTIVSRNYRLANPCTCEGEAPGTTMCMFNNVNPDRVVLK